MVQISFWFMLIMLMYWVGTYSTVHKNTETLAVAGKEIGQAANAEKTKYMSMYGE
jgi:hypothetical protein